MSLTESALWLSTISVLALVLLVRLKTYIKPVNRRQKVAFFHPFAECGGGGERVLWAAVDALARESGELELYVYCSGACSETELAAHANSRFNLDVSPESFTVVPICHRRLLVPALYPRLTMVCQALASVFVTIECLWCMIPDVWIDTTGWAFGYPLVKLLGSRVVAYVHYPTVSSDMLLKVRNREASFNNSDAFVSSSLLSLIKRAYYQLFSYWYGFCGGWADVCMVNSSWTKAHIEDIWWDFCRKSEPNLVYPPCDTVALHELPLDRSLEPATFVSVAQFRPEKNHEVQLEAIALARQASSDSDENKAFNAKFIMIGGCRDEADYARVDRLKARAAELELGKSVQFFVNVPFPRLQQLLGASIAGLHGMKDEHFGISVVEYMAAGSIPIAHNSAGPKGDIVTKETGFLCETAKEYSQSIMEVLQMTEKARLKMAEKARARSILFSQDKFQKGFCDALRSSGILRLKRS